MGFEPDNWQAFYEGHGAAMLLYARQFTQSLDDAEDAVQAGFVHYWQSRHKAKDPRAYLYACVRSAARGEVRSQRRRRVRELTAGGGPRTATWFDCPVERDEDRQLLEAALARLPIDQRGVVVLKVWGELTFEQIAMLYRASPNTVASRYRYALRALRKHLARASSRRA